MKRIIIRAAMVFAALSLTMVGSASASPSPISGGSNAKACSTSGKALVNVHYTLTNDGDSGVAGNTWATDTLNRQLQIWRVGDSTGPGATGVYCVSVTDQGSFVTMTGASPQNTGTVAGGIIGKIKGGYTTNAFDGTFAATLPTSGNLGTFDANDPTHPSFLSYFSSPDSIAWSQPVWGWSYSTAHNGTWLNASTGNLGDITS